MSRISIALCTFNGSKYLKDQLDSLAHQTRQPDELIICDDGSSDNTTDIVNTFSKSVSFESKLVINNKTLGPTKNFEKAIGLCTGDLIALSDQDDVWHPKKLESYETILQHRLDIGALFSNSEVVDEFLNSLGYDMWHKCNFTPKEQQRMMNGETISILLKHYVVTGATMIFRADFKSAILPIPPFWFHDAWIALLLASISKLAFVSKPLSKYRQHSANQLGGTRKNLIQEILNAFRINRSDYYQLEVLRYNTLYGRLLNLMESVNVSKDISLLKDKIEHLRIRQRMPKKRLRRLPAIAGELRRSRYSRYARNWGSLAMDLLFK